MTKQKWSISGLATELGKDRRFVGKIVGDLEPAGKNGKTVLYYMADVVNAIVGSGDLDANQERARKDAALADKYEREVAVLDGRLVDGEEVAEVIKDGILRVRGKLRPLGSALAPRLAKDATVAGCQRIVDAGVDEALGELAAMRIEERG